MQRPPLPPHRQPPHYAPVPVQPRWRSAIARPQVWLSGLGFLALAGLGWQFSQRPDWQQALIFNQPNGADASNAAPDGQVGADIDALSALNADLAPTPLLDPKLSATEALAQLKDKDKAAPNDHPLSLETLLGGLPGANKLQPNNSLTGGLGGSPTGLNLSGLNLPGLNAPGFSFASGLNASTTLANRSATTGSNSLLDSALNRYSPAKANPAAPFAVNPSEPKTAPIPNPAVTPIAGNSGFEPIAPPTAPSNPIAGTSTVNPALLASPDSGLNSYTGLTNSATLPDSPVYGGRSVDRGVAAPSAILRSPTDIAVPIGSTPMPPGGATPIAVPAPQPDPPFSVPRSTPGRSIGGGAIGTFSNP
jgi:hypothetical protein